MEDYKTKYKVLKRKLKLLIYENESFQEELRKSQRALLRVRRDKSFLLDRLLHYYKEPESSSDSEKTDDSDLDSESKSADKKRKLNNDANTTFSNLIKANKKKKSFGGSSKNRKNSLKQSSLTLIGNIEDCQLSREEVERHLAARQPLNDFSTTVSLTVPHQLFSDNFNEIDIKEEEIDTSPSNLEEDIALDSFE